MKRCIVIADDDPTIISLVSLRLGLARYNVLSASNGEDALRLVHDNHPVAVVLDVQMPRKTGLDVLGALKANPLTSLLPVMMLTGERSPDTVMQAMSGGADDYMVKPFNPDTLLERVSRLVKSSAMVWTGAAMPALAPMPASAPASGPVWEL